MVITWSKSISRILNTKFDLSTGTTIQEINYWMSYERALLSIKSQKEQPEVLLTLATLKANQKIPTWRFYTEQSNIKNKLQNC